MPESSVVRDERTSPLDPVFVSALDAARLLGLSRSEVYKLLDSGVIESRRYGTRRLVLLESVRQFAAGLPGPLPAA